MSIAQEALAMLEETSRTFFIPISRLPDRLQEAVMSGYLCLRAIDEVEDHPGLDTQTKARLLRAISYTLQAPFDASDFAPAFASHRRELPEVTLRVGDWAMLAPPIHCSARVGGDGNYGGSHGAMGGERLDDSDRGRP